MTTLAIPLLADLGAPELLIILAVVVLLFGARKLPELARGSGRALRIFKAETRGLADDEDEDETTTDTRTTEQLQRDAQRGLEAQRQLDAQRQLEAQRQVETQRREGVQDPAAPRQEPGSTGPTTTS